ncbi:hypothetical protein HDV05_005528 [Chytridiales sp. JEL 0842]|nr:hypothetical protein HDV05_005528 [Chytridiales sp. JEL 0842]
MPTFGRYTYVGCFDDYSDRILRDAPIYVDPQMAIEKCHVRAQSMGAKHFGAERKVENKEYSVACAGSAGVSNPDGTVGNDTCGYAWRLQLYVFESLTTRNTTNNGAAPTSSGAASTNGSGGVNIAAKTEEQGGLSTGTIAGITIGVFLVVSLIIVGATYKLRQQKAARNKATQNPLKFLSFTTSTPSPATTSLSPQPQQPAPTSHAIQLQPAAPHSAASSCSIVS